MRWSCAWSCFPSCSASAIGTSGTGHPGWPGYYRRFASRTELNRASDAGARPVGLADGTFQVQRQQNIRPQAGLMQTPRGFRGRDHLRVELQPIAVRVQEIEALRDEVISRHLDLDAPALQLGVELSKLLRSTID